MFMEFIAIAIISLLLWDFVKKKHRNDILTEYNIQGPKALPIIGASLEMRGINPDNFMQFQKNNKQKYGKIFHIWVLHQLTVLTSNVEHFEAILGSQQLIKKSSLYDFLLGWLGNGLLLSYGKKWHSRRKIITPTFHFKILEQFVEIFDQQSTIMVEKLREKADGKQSINIFPIICLEALDIIAETAMGVKVHAQNQEESAEYVKALAIVADIMAKRFISPTMRTDWLFRLTSPRMSKELQRNIDIMHRFTNKVIEERRNILEKSIADGTYRPYQPDNEGTKKRMALLDVLLQSSADSGQPLSNEDIREEVETFMFEGHDTTTSAVAFCLYEISRHPNVQQKLVAEINQVIGQDKSKSVGIRELQELKYLEHTIKEALRLYPSVPAIGREFLEDTKIGDLVIPAKSNVNLMFFMAMRDPDYFHKPNEFIPERFEDAKANHINPFAFVPFSAGPRNCIGQKFAMLELKSTISKVLRYYELLPQGPDVQLIINIILRSNNGVHIGLKPRQ